MLNMKRDFVQGLDHKTLFDFGFKHKFNSDWTVLQACHSYELLIFIAIIKVD